MGRNLPFCVISTSHGNICKGFQVHYSYWCKIENKIWNGNDWNVWRNKDMEIVIFFISIARCKYHFNYQQ